MSTVSHTMSFFRVSALCGALALPLLLASCGSSQPRGLPRKLPVVNLYGSPQTPSHSMERKDYPFDPNGNYVTAWASEGERAASDDDVARWQASHGGSVSRRQPSPVSKVSSKKKTASSSSSKSKSKTSKSKNVASSSRSGGGSYTIKKGDTLGAIARKNNTTVAKLKAANGMNSDFIREGKALKIPR